MSRSRSMRWLFRRFHTRMGELFRSWLQDFGHRFSKPLCWRHPRARLCLEELETRSLLSVAPVAAYNFSAGQGTALLDVTGNGNNGSIANAAWSSGSQSSANWLSSANF